MHSGISKTAWSENWALTFDQQITLPSLWFWTDDTALGNRVHSCRQDRELRIWFLRFTGGPLSKLSPQWMTSVFISIKWGEESNLAFYIALRFTDKTHFLDLWCFVKKFIASFSLLPSILLTKIQGVVDCCRGIRNWKEVFYDILFICKECMDLHFLPRRRNQTSQRVSLLTASNSRLFLRVRLSAAWTGCASAPFFLHTCVEVTFSLSHAYTPSQFFQSPLKLAFLSG